MRNEWKYKKVIQSDLFQYFSYFIMVSFIITLILGASLYLNFSSAFRNEAIQSNLNTLEQLRNAQETILSEVDKSLASIVLDPLIVNYTDYIYDIHTTINLFAAQSRLDNVMASNESIHSIEIYYEKAGLVLSSNLGSSNIENFYDKTFLESILSEDFKNSFVRTRNITNLDTSEDLAVISIIKPIPLNFQVRPNALVVVNIKGSYLQKTIDQIQVKKNSSVVVTDYSGNIISHKKDSSDLKEVVSKITEDAEDGIPSGYLIKKINGVTTLFSVINSDKYHWRYIYTVPMATVTSSIRFLSMITIFMCMAVIVLSSIISYFLSKKLYSPIRSILSLFKGNHETAMVDKGSIKETAEIQRNIHRLIDRNENLENLMKDYEVYQKNNFLQRIVDGSREGDKKISEKLSYYGIKFDLNQYFAAFIISMDNFSAFSDEYSEKQQNMLFVYIKENITREILHQYNGFIVDTDISEIAILLNLNENVNFHEVKTASYSIAQQIHQLVTENMKYTFTIGVSLPQKGMNKISDCYRQAAAAVNYRLLFGHNNVLLYENVKMNEDSTSSYPFSIERSILNSLKVGDRDGAMESLEQFVQYIYRNPSDNIEFIRHYFMQLLSASIKCIYEMDKNIYLASVTQKDIYTSLTKEETMQGMVSQIRLLYQEILKHLDEQRNIKNRELVSSVIRYIENNLQMDLSIEKLAEQFYISASHLRKIFKDETGETIKEYIDSTRMKKVKALLEDPSRKISDIAVQAGYFSLQTFNRAFKLETGKTPSQYRTEYHAIQNIPPAE